MFSKLTVAKVTRIRNVVRINSSPLTGLLVFIVIAIPIALAAFLILQMDAETSEYSFVIIPLLLFGIFFFYQFLNGMNSRDMTISKRFGIDILIRDDRDIQHLKIKQPSFIKLYVEPQNTILE